MASQNKERPVRTNLAYSIVYQASSILIPFVTAPYISRVLGAEELGTYSYSYSIASVFLLFTMMGMSNHGNRATASTARDKVSLGSTFINNYVIQLTCGILIFFTYLAYCYTLKADQLLAFVQSLVVLSGVLDITWFFSGLEDFKLIALRGIIFKSFGAIAIFLFIKSPSDTWLYALIMALTLLLTQATMWLFLKSRITVPRPSWRLIKQNIKPTFVLFIPVLSYSVYMLIDKVQLGQLADMAQVGYYSNAEKIMIIPTSLATALGSVMLPRATRVLAEGNRSAHTHYALTSFSFVAVVQGFLCFGISAIALPFAPWYFGGEYSETGEVLQILIFAPLASGLANVIRTQYLIPMRKDHVYVISTAFAAATNFILNIALIPLLQARGAAISTLLAEISVLAIQAIGARKQLPWPQVASAVLPYLSIGLITYAVVSVSNAFLGLCGISKMVFDIIEGSSCYLILLFAVSKKGKFVSSPSKRD